MGSGKTSLVEHLAKITGRNGPPYLSKVFIFHSFDNFVVSVIQILIWPIIVRNLKRF